jgi:hypothetical protein
MTLLRALLVFAWTDVTIIAQDTEASVGKVRSSADVAFSSGEIDQALKLWGKVTLTLTPILTLTLTLTLTLKSYLSSYKENILYCYISSFDYTSPKC